MAKSRRARVARKKRAATSTSQSRNDRKSLLSVFQSSRSPSMSRKSYEYTNSTKFKFPYPPHNVTYLHVNDNLFNEAWSHYVQIRDFFPSKSGCYLEGPAKDPSTGRSIRQKGVAKTTMQDGFTSLGSVTYTPNSVGDDSVLELACNFVLNCFDDSLQLKPHSFIEPYMPSKETRIDVENFISALRAAKVIDNHKLPKLQLITHIAEVTYTNVLLDTHIGKTTDNIPKWFKTHNSEEHTKMFLVGSIDGLDGIDGLGIASFTYDDRLATTLNIYCFPHYKHFQWRLLPRGIYTCDMSMSIRIWNSRVQSTSEQYHWCPSSADSSDVLSLFEQCLTTWSPFTHSTYYPLSMVWIGRRYNICFDERTGVIDRDKHRLYHGQTEYLKHSHWRCTNKLKEENRMVNSIKRGKYQRNSNTKHARLKKRTMKVEHVHSIESPDEENLLMWPLSRLDCFARWKQGPGRAKAWKACKVIKMNGKDLSSWISTSTKVLIRKTSILQTPKYLQSSMYDVRNPTKKFDFYAGTAVRGRIDTFEIDFALRPRRKGLINHTDFKNHKPTNLSHLYSIWSVDKASMSHSPFEPEHRSHEMKPPPRSIRQLLPLGKISIPGQNIARLGTYAGLIIAPCYLLGPVRVIEAHTSVFESTDLNNVKTKYILTAVNVNVPDAISSGATLYRYRLKIVKRLQKRSDYLDTTGQYGLIWIVQQYTPSPPTDMSTSEDLTKIHRILKRGTREFKEAFPLLPRVSRQKKKAILGSTLETPSLKSKNAAQTTKSTSASSIVCATHTKAEKEREAQRRRRMFKREWTRLQAVSQMLQ